MKKSSDGARLAKQGSEHGAENHPRRFHGRFLNGILAGMVFRREEEACGRGHAGTFNETNADTACHA